MLRPRTAGGIGRVLWCEGEFCVDLRCNAAAVAHHHLDVFQAESFCSEDGGERVPCRVGPAFLLDACCFDGLVVPALERPDGHVFEDWSGTAFVGVEFDVLVQAAAQWYDPVFPALARTYEELVAARVEIAQVELLEFGNPEASLYKTVDE